MDEEVLELLIVGELGVVEDDVLEKANELGVQSSSMEGFDSG